MGSPDETLIRERAYLIWMREGCPADAADRNWQQAKDELEALLSVDFDSAAASEDDHAADPDDADHATLVAGPEARSDDK